MKKIILFAIVCGFSVNIKSNQEEELKEVWNKIKNIQSQLGISKVYMEKIYFIHQKKQYQDQLENIKKSLPEGRGDEIIKDLENKSKIK